MSTVLVVNSGSSSIKYQLVDVTSGEAVAKGLVERIGEDESTARHTGTRGEVEHDGRLADHEAGLRWALGAFDTAGPDLSEAGLVAIGHRVVHGGSRFAEATLIDDAVVDAIEDLVPLAPLHNPPNLQGIRTARRLFPDLPQVAVFDTAFHQTLPPEAYTYAVDRDVAARYRVRKYGFHGTSHAFVSRTAASFLGRDPASVNVIVLHLGNGASASAVAGGRCVETSMGLTPLDGLIMGTRCGTLDPAVVFHLVRVAGMSVDDIDDLLNKRSGMLGLAGDNDLREVARLADGGDQAARDALASYAYRIRSYVGSFAAALGRVDAIAFTAGVGENDARMRAAALAGLESWGIVVDPALNVAESRQTRAISSPASPVAVLVVPTNEELEIAREAAELVGS